MSGQISHCQTHKMKFVLYNLMISGGTSSQQTYIPPKGSHHSAGVLLISKRPGSWRFSLQQLSGIMETICLKEELFPTMVFMILRGKWAFNWGAIQKGQLGFSSLVLKWKACCSQNSSRHPWGNHNVMFLRCIDDVVSSAIASLGGKDWMAKGHPIMAFQLTEANKLHAFLTRVH